MKKKYKKKNFKKIIIPMTLAGLIISGCSNKKVIDNKENVKTIEIEKDMLKSIEKKKYKLSNIYVFETNHENIEISKSSAFYNYDYMFIESDEFPILKKGKDKFNFNTDVINCLSFNLNEDSYDSPGITNTDEYPYVGIFIVNCEDGKLPYTKPLEEYLDTDDKKEFYTKEEIETLFYKLNLREKVKRKVLID